MIYLLLLISFLWGSTFIFQKVLIGEPYNVPISFIVSCRFLISTILFGIIFYKKIRLNKRVIRNGIIIGGINGIALIVQLLGLQYTTVSNSAFLTTTYIIFVPFIELFIWKVKIKRLNIISIIIAFSGVFLLSFSDISSFVMNEGDMITIVCGFLYALQIFFISHYTKQENSYSLVFIQFLISALIGFIYIGSDMFLGNIGSFNFVHVMGNPKVILNLLTLSIICTFIPFSLQFYVQKYVSPTSAGMAYLLEPVFALILAFIFLGERMSLQASFGAILIFSGVILVNFKFKKRRS